MHDRYVSPFSTRYASDEMQYLFSDDKKFRTWRALWIALARAEQHQGLPITDEQIAELEQRLSDLKTKELMQRDKGIDTDEIRSFLDVSEMTEKEWDRFIDKVVLYPNHKMVIQWKFEEEL